MTGAIELSAAEQRIIRGAISWVIHETYGFTERPRLSDHEINASALLLERFNTWFGSKLDTISVMEESCRHQIDCSSKAVPDGSLTLIRVAVHAFLNELLPIPNEFKIVTGLAPEIGERLRSRLRSLDLE